MVINISHKQVSRKRLNDTCLYQKTCTSESMLKIKSWERICRIKTMKNQYQVWTCLDKKKQCKIRPISSIVLFKTNTACCGQIFCKKSQMYGDKTA